MLAYLASTVWAGSFGTLASSGRDPVKRFLLGLLSVLPYCLVAGLRDVAIGTDTGGYPYTLYLAASSYDFSGYLSTNMVQQTEPLFSAITWVATALFGSFNFNLFVYQLLVAAPILFCLFKLVPRNVGLGLMLYGLLSFPYSLNIIRQSISGAFLLVSFVYMLESRYGLYVLFLAISTGFHNTGLLGLIVYPVVQMAQNLRSSSSSLARRKNAEMLIVFGSLAISAGVLILAFGSKWVYLLGNIKASYIDQTKNIGEDDLILSVILLCVIYVVLYAFVFHGKAGSSSSPQLLAAMILFVLGGALCQCSVISPNMNRVGRGLIMFVSLFGPMLISETGKREKPVVYAGMLGMALAYFFYVYVVVGECDVIPYSSTIFPVLGLA